MTRGARRLSSRNERWRFPERMRFPLPALTLALSCLWFGCKSIRQHGAGASDPHLAGEVAKIHFVWTNWLQKPKLYYDPISTNRAVRLCGRWLGSFDDAGERLILDLLLMTNGTWSSEAFRPEMTNGHWALAEGMILLFEQPLSETPQVASALVIQSRKLRMLVADSETGYLELHRR